MSKTEVTPLGLALGYLVLGPNISTVNQSTQNLFSNVAYAILPDCPDAGGGIASSLPDCPEGGGGGGSTPITGQGDEDGDGYLNATDICHFTHSNNHLQCLQDAGLRIPTKIDRSDFDWEPHPVMDNVLTPQDIDAMRDTYRERIERIHECHDLRAYEQTLENDAVWLAGIAAAIYRSSSNPFALLLAAYLAIQAIRISAWADNADDVYNKLCVSDKLSML